MKCFCMLSNVHVAMAWWSNNKHATHLSASKWFGQWAESESNNDGPLHYMTLQLYYCDAVHTEMAGTAEGVHAAQRRRNGHRWNKIPKMCIEHEKR